MKQLTLTEETAIQLYNEGNDSTKQSLIKQFGEEIFTRSSDWIELWDKFCKENKLSVTLPHDNPVTSDQEWDNACVMLRYIISIRRKGWVPDWNDRTQYKYYPWFNMSGSGFSYRDYEDDRSCSILGSRLCFPTSKLAEATAKEFLPIYEKFIK